MDIFAFMDGASPWWWVALALALGIFEILTLTFFLIWPALAALAVAIVLWIVPDMSGTGQIIMFAVLSAVATLAGRQWVLSRKPVTEDPGLNNRAAQLIGRTATLIEDLAGDTVGGVEVDGIRWRGRLTADITTATAGDVLRVQDVDGMVLLLSPRT